MSSRVRIGIALFAVVLAHGCGTTPAESLPPPASTAFDLDADPELIDGSAVKVFEVLIENRTGQPVRFGPMSCACSCSTSTRERDQLEPGESTTARLTVSTAGRTGKQRFLCQWADDAQRAWSASVNVELLGSEQFEPSSISLGAVKPDERVTRTANLVQTWKAGTPAPSPPVLLPTDRNVRVSPSESKLVSLGGKLQRRITPVLIEIDARRDAGYDSTKLLNATVPTTLQPSAQLSIDWKVTPDVVAIPARIVFCASERERAVRVESANGQPMPVLSATCGHPALKVSKTADSNQIVVARVPGVEPQPSFAEIAIVTENSSRVVIPVVLPEAVK